jgi:hypothetical protein
VVWRAGGGGETLLLLVRNSQGEGMWQRVKSRDPDPSPPGVSSAMSLLAKCAYDANTVVSERGELINLLKPSGNFTYDQV